MKEPMNIRRVSLLQHAGLLGAIMASQCGIVAGWVVDESITVLQRSDGSFSFKAHDNKKITKKLEAKIIRKIKT